MEFFQHMIKEVQKHEHAIQGGSFDPTTVFQFTLEQRLQCKECGGVRYSTSNTTDLSLPVPMDTATVPSAPTPMETTEGIFLFS